MKRLRNNFFTIFFGVIVLASTVFAYVITMAPDANAQLGAGSFIVGRVFERNREFSEPIRWWGARGGCTAPAGSGLDYRTNGSMRALLDASSRPLNWYCDNPLPNGTAFIGNTAVADRHFQFFTSGLADVNSSHRIRFQAPPGYVCKGYIATQFDLSVSLAMRGLSGGPGSFYEENTGSDQTVCNIHENAFLGSSDQIRTEEWDLPTPGIINELLFEIAPAQPAPAAPTAPTAPGRIVGRVRVVGALHESIAASTYVGPNANCPARQDGRSNVLPVTIEALSQRLEWNCDRPIADPEHYQFYGTELLPSSAPARTVIFTAPRGYTCVGWVKTTNGITTNSAFDDPKVGSNRSDGNTQRCEVDSVVPGTMTQRLTDLSVPPVSEEGTHLWFEVQPAAQQAEEFVNFSIDPVVIDSGGGSTLSWQSRGASELQLNYRCRPGIRIFAGGREVVCDQYYRVDNLPGLGFNANLSVQGFNDTLSPLVAIFRLRAVWASGNEPAVIPRSISINRNKAPEVSSCTFTPVSGYAPLTTQFRASARDPEGGALHFRWSFGDGTNILSQDIANPIHQYQSPGRYRVVVTVVDDQGSQTANVCGNVVVFGDTFVLAPSSASVAVGKTAILRPLYDPDGPDGPRGEQEVLPTAVTTRDPGIITVQSIQRGRITISGQQTGTTAITAFYQGENKCKTCSGEATAIITVTATPNTPPEIVNNQCITRDISTTETTVTEEFTATVRDSDDGSAVTCTFNFGDGERENFSPQMNGSGTQRLGVCHIQHPYQRQTTDQRFTVTVQAADNVRDQSAQVQCSPVPQIPGLGTGAGPTGGTQPAGPAAPGGPALPSGPGGTGGPGGSAGPGVPGGGICGDGIQDPGEGCDDGNTTNFDGCASTCQLETSAAPSGDGGGRGGRFSGSLDVVPDSTTIRASTTAQFRAFFSAVGSGQRVDETNASDLIWEADGADIAENLGAGRFHGRRPGTTRVSAHFRSAPQFSDSAELIVLSEGTSGLRAPRAAARQGAGSVPINLSADAAAYCAADERMTFSWDANAAQRVFELRVATDGATGDDGGLYAPVFLQTTAATTLSTPPGAFALDTEYVWQVRALARSGDLSAPQYAVPVGVAPSRRITGIASYQGNIYLAVGQETESFVAQPSLYVYDPSRPNASPEPVRLDRADAPSAFRRPDNRVHTLIPFQNSLLFATGGTGAQAVYAYDGERVRFLFQLPGGVADSEVFGGRLYLIAQEDAQKIYVYDGSVLSVAFDNFLFQEARVDRERLMVSYSSNGSTGPVRASAQALAAHGGKLVVAVAAGGSPSLVSFPEGQNFGRPIGTLAEGVAGLYFFDGTNWEFPQASNWEGRRPRFIDPESTRAMRIFALASYGGDLFIAGQEFRTTVETGFAPQPVAALYAERAETFMAIRDPGFGATDAVMTNLLPVGDLLLAAVHRSNMEGNTFYVVNPEDPQFSAFADDVGKDAAFKDGSLYLFSAVSPLELLRYDLFGFSDWSELALFATPRTCARGLFRIFDLFREI